MKKNKFIALAALSIATCMTACCGGADEPTKCVDGKHTWGEYETLKEATCTEEGSKQRTCTVCGEKEDAKKISKKSHTNVEETEKRVEATCTAKGTKYLKCSVCGNESTEDIAMKDHTYGEVTYTQNVSCTDEGIGTKECTVCHHVENVREDALEHDWDETVVTQQPTCTEDGVGTKTCKRCSVVEADNPAKLGHKMVVEEGAPATDGKAAVRLYHCTNTNCDQVYFGFKASEASDDPDAKEGEGLVRVTDEETGEVGVKFFGRPIGNNLELDENGDSVLKANIEDLSTVYDPTIKGDLIAYKFDITAEQLALIGEEVVLWCDAKPANYLDGQDFWACDPSAEEWTRGMYTEGEHAGEPINTYRYILYFNEEPVAFEDSMKAPVPVKPGASGAGNADLPRGEFVMPYIFHLQEGTNSISLRMAGGYKSTFYNFTFRPYEAPEVLPEPAKLGSFSALDYTSASEGIGNAANPAVSGTTKGISFKNVYNVGTPGTSENSWTQTPPVAESDASAGDKVVYTVNADKAVTGAKLVMTVNYANAYGTVPVFSKVNNDGTKGYTWNGTAWNAEPYRYKLFVNDVEVALDATVEGYEEPNFAAGRDVVAEFPCTFDLKAGENKIEIQNYGGYNPVISNFEIQAANGVDAKVKVVPHTHDFTVGEKAADSALRAVTACSICGLSGYELKAEDVTEGQNAPVSSDKNTRLGKNNKYDDVWNITGIEAGTYEVYLNGQVSSGNAKAGYWNSATAIENGGKASDNGSTPELQAEYKYKIKVGDGEYVNLGNNVDNYAATGLGESAAAWTTKALATITIEDGATTITVHNMDNGYSIWVYGIRLMKVAA